MKKTKFICIKDLQGGDFAVGASATIEEWRKIALDWADNDNNNELYETIKKLPTKQVIEFIKEIWQIIIIPTNN